MSITYRPPGASGTVTFKGKTAFAQCSLGKPNKSEYGLDSMAIDYTGAAPLLPAFLATLAQGKRLDANGRAWYAQQWTVDESKVWPIVSIHCVGFAGGEPPKPIRRNSVITQSITVTATVTESQGDPPEDVQVAVTREIVYRCLQTSWSYISLTEPINPKIGRVSLPINPRIISSVITAVGGTTNATYTGANAPAPYVTATTPAIVDFLLDLDATQIPGTTWFDTEEVVSRIFIAA